ncbi:MAG: translation initiation factor IF-5A [Nanohaloarchaea archaeon]|nr:translation initiation factor IF-5A [Candidatus Nanohaloarchaea archaeon]
MAMDSKQINARDAKKGNYVIFDDVVCKVTDNKISKPGKHGEAKCRIEAVGILDDKKRVHISPAGHRLISPILDKRTCQVLSISGNTAQVMDMETYETFDIEITDDMKDKIVEGEEFSYWNILDKMVFTE